MKSIDLSVFGKFSGRLEPVRNLLSLYQQSEYSGQRTIVIKKIIEATEDCPLYIVDLLITEAIRQLGIETPMAISIVAEWYKEIIRRLMAEIRGVNRCLEEKM